MIKAGIMKKTSNKNEIVWVYGSSAAGKKTFILTILENKPLDLIESLGWRNKQIILCSESIEWITQYKGDPLGAKREGIPQIVVNLSNNNENSVILIKGQDLDLKNNRLLKVKAKLPGQKHRIIFLHADIDEIFKRINAKEWFDPKKETKDKLKEWLRGQIGYLQELRDDFGITVIRSNHEQNYQIINLSLDNILKNC